MEVANFELVDDPSWNGDNGEEMEIAADDYPTEDQFLQSETESVASAPSQSLPGRSGRSRRRQRSPVYSGSETESSSASEEDEPMEDVPQQPVRAYNRGRTRSRRGQQGVRAFNEAGVIQDDPPPAAAPPVPAAAPPVPAAAPVVPAAPPLFLYQFGHSTRIT